MAQHRKLVDWKSHITRQKKSGLTVKEYSRREGFSSWLFYRHRKKLHRQTGFLESKSNPAPIAHSSFIPIGTLQSVVPRITIRFPDSTRLELHTMPNPEDLACIVSTLQRYSGGR